MKWNYLVAIVVTLLILSSCAQPPTPTPTPTLVTIPEEILASHFGIGRVEPDTDEITRLGIRWTKPFANPFGPFIWGMIERERGEYLIFH